MNNILNIEEARIIMGDNFIGPDELRDMKLLHLCVEDVPQLTYSRRELEEKKEDYLLVMGVPFFTDGSPVTIRNIKRVMGSNPDVKEPCFYNQDWYDKERFVDIPVKKEWILIRKYIYENSRGVAPEELKKSYKFQSAINCTYAFFVSWLVFNRGLWLHEYVWCSDKDHNGDQIYVGKYYDIDGVNKNGFSIHRHLSLRECYACID